jgi:F-type H+-transporting ATPase subunit b
VLATLSVIVASATAVANELTPVVEETKNPILPVVSEMFWSGVFFLALWAMMKFVLLPPIVKTMDARAQKVRDDQAAAEAASTERVAKIEQYEAGLAGARSEAVSLLEQARSEGDAERRTQIAAAEADVASLRASAATEIADAKVRARSELAGSIADIAVGAAEAVVQKPIDRSAQVQLVEDYVNRAGSQN